MQPFTTDVLILGGGINGAGLLRELALNGVDALLIDKADFAAGATSASSRMIHGGLRYLENGEFHLVREALRERNRLLKNAPHAVKPLPTTIPIFSRWSGFANAAKKFFAAHEKPSKRGAAPIKIGLTLYDLFSGRDRILPLHHFSSRAAALRKRPQLHPDIVCTATYYDAWVALPERLCLELIDDACALHPGAVAINYCSVAS
ncbi:MAG: FAD-dependent oxidoreductase, partial [Verrucomicrobiota bacterium]|nr:FAD-dependent oxidoreductase [Verrucomicrobiota bacterium]